MAAPLSPCRSGLRGSLLVAVLALTCAAPPAAERQPPEAAASEPAASEAAASEPAASEAAASEPAA
ncbi:MAG: glycoside hydrolase, partial [Acidobacteria bacterium]